ncbi:DUF2272 domain-containing protein [soil metagenome]
MHFRSSLFFMLALQAGLAAQAFAQDCVPSKPLSTLGAQIAQTALKEYAEFNGHRINADGYLWKSGATEAESTLLRNPETGMADAGRPGRFVWRRVWEYWLTLEKHATGEALDRKIFSTSGLLDDPLTVERTKATRLSELFSTMTAELPNADVNADAALRQSAVRAAISDSPWSAAFISHVMDRAGLSDEQFRYAPAHWQYVQQAFEPSRLKAYQACDPRLTVPRVGDLLCHARGTKPLKTFSAWRDAVKSPEFAAPSHCEVVVEVDAEAKKMELVGGNVLQSVTRRTLKLNQANRLSLAHDPERRRVDRNSRACDRDKTCQQPNLNLQYWSVLLQLR